MTATRQSSDEVRVTDIQLEVQIAASPDAVWHALTADIGQWWPSTFYCGSGRSETPVIELEARPGGRMWEDWGDGDGLLWGNVVSVVAGKTLDVVGSVGAAWGGPNTWHGSFTLTADGDGTKVRFAESAFGRISDSALGEKEKGWLFLLATLRAHLEGTKPPTWED